MSRKWQIAAGCFGLGLISFVILFYIVHLIEHVPVGYSSPPPTTTAGVIQAVIAALSAAGFTLSGVAVSIINLWHSHNGTVAPVNPSTPQPVAPAVPPNALQDLIDAFPAWIADRSNSAKSRRFWFDMIEAGIQVETNPEIRAWLTTGAMIFCRNYFPTESSSSSSSEIPTT